MNNFVAGKALQQHVLDRVIEAWIKPQSRRRAHADHLLVLDDDTKQLLLVSLKFLSLRFDKFPYGVKVPITNGDKDRGVRKAAKLQSLMLKGKVDAQTRSLRRTLMPRPFAR